MLKFPTHRVSAAAGVAVLAAFAAAPMAAQAADTDATGTLTGGTLAVTAPAVTPFSATLTGLTQTKNTAVGAWTATDPTGSNDGYSITVSATAPEVDADGAGPGTPALIVDSTIKLYTTEAAPVGGNTHTAPEVQAAQQLDVDGTPTASTIQNAEAGTGQGPWSFPADAGLNTGLEVVIPGTATPGDYSSTLTYTTAVPVV
jgi:hypothetical protein